MRGGSTEFCWPHLLVVVAVVIVTVVVAVAAIGADGLGRAAATRPRLASPFSSRPRPSCLPGPRCLPSTPLAPPSQCRLGVTQLGLKNSKKRKCADDPASFIYACQPLARESFPMTSMALQPTEPDRWLAWGAAHRGPLPIDSSLVALCFHYSW